MSVGEYIKKSDSTSFKIMISPQNINMLRDSSKNFVKNQYIKNKNSKTFDLYGSNQDFIGIKLENRSHLELNEIKSIQDLMQEQSTKGSIQNIHQFLNIQKIKADVIPFKLGTYASPFKIENYPNKSHLTIEATLEHINRNFERMKEKSSKDGYTYIFYLKCDFYLYLDKEKSYNL